MINNDYYSIASNDLKFLQAALNTNLYNQIAVQAQQITEKMLKSVAERVCVGIEKLLLTHNLRAIYQEINKVYPEFILDKGQLSILKDMYFDAKYPGDNYVSVDKNSCTECLEIMYDTIQKVSDLRAELGLPICEYQKKMLYP